MSLLTGTWSATFKAVLTRAGIDPALEGEDLQEALHQAIALRRYSCTWTKLHTGWVVTLQFPEPHHFFGQTLEEALAWCLEWIMAETGRETRDQERPRRTGRWSGVRRAHARR
jgi:predicted RNase H-like HicB family nuclease